MKLIKTILIIFIFLLVLGCNTVEEKETQTKSSTTFAVVEISETKGYCVLTASAESDGRFLMIDKLFSEAIPCNTNDDCYNFLLEKDDYRSLASEYEPYLNCEARTIPPVQK